MVKSECGGVDVHEEGGGEKDGEGAAFGVGAGGGYVFLLLLDGEASDILGVILGVETAIICRLYGSIVCGGVWFLRDAVCHTDGKVWVVRRPDPRDIGSPFGILVCGCCVGCNPVVIIDVDYLNTWGLRHVFFRGDGKGEWVHEA